MPTLNQIRNRCDAFLADRWATFVAAQDTFFASHGRYWQGLLTHSGLPSHSATLTNDALPDRLSVHPTDQSEDWAAFLPQLAGVSFPAALRCDVYEAAAGKGFAVTLLVRHNGITYQRTAATGPLAGDYARAWGVFGEET